MLFNNCLSPQIHSRFVICHLESYEWIISRYITWLRPERHTHTAATSGAGNTVTAATTSNTREEEEGAASPSSSDDQSQPEGQQRRQAWPGQASEPYQLPSLGVWHAKPAKELGGAPSALSLLLSSSIFKSMRERTALTEATEVDTKFDPGVGMGSHSRFHEAPQTSRFYEEPSSEIFSPDVHYEMSIPPNYASQEAVTQAGPMYSQSTACWDPFVQPLTAQQLSSC